MGFFLAEGSNLKRLFGSRLKPNSLAYASWLKYLERVFGSRLKPKSLAYASWLSRIFARAAAMFGHDVLARLQMVRRECAVAADEPPYVISLNLVRVALALGFPLNEKFAAATFTLLGIWVGEEAM